TAPQPVAASQGRSAPLKVGALSGVSSTGPVAAGAALGGAAGVTRGTPPGTGNVCMLPGYTWARASPSHNPSAATPAVTHVPLMRLPPERSTDGKPLGARSGFA